MSDLSGGHTSLLRLGRSLLPSALAFQNRALPECASQKCVILNPLQRLINSPDLSTLLARQNVPSSTVTIGSLLDFNREAWLQKDLQPFMPRASFFRQELYFIINFKKMEFCILKGVKNQSIHRPSSITAIVDMPCNSSGSFRYRTYHKAHDCPNQIGSGIIPLLRCGTVRLKIACCCLRVRVERKPKRTDFFFLIIRHHKYLTMIGGIYLCPKRGGIMDTLTVAQAIPSSNEHSKSIQEEQINQLDIISPIKTKESNVFRFDLPPTPTASDDEIEQIKKKGIKLARRGTVSLADLIPVASAALKAKQRLANPDSQQSVQEPQDSLLARALTKVKIGVQTHRLKEKYLTNEWKRLALSAPVDDTTINLGLEEVKTNRTKEIVKWYEHKLKKVTLSLAELEQRVDELRKQKLLAQQLKEQEEEMSNRRISVISILPSSRAASDDSEAH
ncbi:hypothetical protein BD560DRAFT_423570 [Blakeslea trispora]|nr:hypothetical protein BD560DRAFT_423570 [Blakeslea trispora]